MQSKGLRPVVVLRFGRKMNSHFKDRRIFWYAAVLLVGICIPLLVQYVSSISLDWRFLNLIRGSTHDPLRNLVDIPGGSFTMGSNEWGAPPHVEQVSGFRIGRTEITAGAYRRFAQEHDPTWTCPADLNQPAANVSYASAQAYCRWLSEQSGSLIRLPTEAEWEYAARGGLDGARYPWGWGAPEKWARFKAEGPAAVGTYPPNPWGIYDMAGNVYEWCAAPEEGAPTCARGGAWSEKDAAFLRVFHRVVFPPGYSDRDVGFRILQIQDAK